MGHGSNWSRKSDGSHGSWVTRCWPTGINYPGNDILPDGYPDTRGSLAWTWMWTWTWNFVSHMHNCTCITDWHDTLSLPSHGVKNWWVMGQHLVTHDPCDPSDFRDPFDPWPMTHRPIPCSGLKIDLYSLQRKCSPNNLVVSDISFYGDIRIGYRERAHYW